MLLPPSPLALLVVTTLDLFSTVQAIKTVEDLFDVSYDRSVGGHCADYGSTRLNAMLGDADVLANSGVAMVTAADDSNNALHAEAIRNLAAWFESPFLTAAQYDKVGDTYQAVSDWLDGKLTTVNGGKSTLKPLLICGDNSFVLRQTMSDQAWGFDKNNNQVKLTHKNNSPFLIRDNPKYVTDQAGTTQVIKEQTYPYWSSRLGVYIFDKMYGVNRAPTDYICAGPTTPNSQAPHGVVKSWLPPKPNTLIMCPSAFRNPDRRTHSVTLNCIDASLLVNTRPPDNNAAKIVNSIQIIPDGATLFHEIIHLVLGGDATKPSTGEEYTPSRLLGKVVRDKTGKVMTSDEAFVNPETYMYAASGFDYSLNAPLFNGHVPEFYTGWCTYQ